MHSWSSLFEDVVLKNGVVLKDGEIKSVTYL